MNAVQRATAHGWQMQERGWWTHPNYGGVCREATGYWGAYPNSGPESYIWPTMTLAMVACQTAAEQAASRAPETETTL